MVPIRSDIIKWEVIKITPDYVSMMSAAKNDICYAIKSWKTVLTSILKENLIYAYAKGSALKKWETEIDYVPILSDLDIHVKLKQGNEILNGHTNPLEKSIELNSLYQMDYERSNPNIFHYPRPQVMVINKLETSVSYIPPLLSDVHLIYGTPKSLGDDKYDSEVLRELDYNNLIKEKEPLDVLPERLIDRSGLDFWTLLRSISWKVSPIPVRMLTQITDEDYTPVEAWRWNRTTIESYLLKTGFTTIASNYREYYLTGWELYLDGFKSEELYRKIIKLGYSVIRDCIIEGQNLHNS